MSKTKTRKAEIEETIEDSAAILTAKLKEKLDQTLNETLSPDLIAVIQPLIPALFNLAVSEGIDVIPHILVGVNQPDSYVFWDKIIAAADTDTRVQLMETERQQAIKDTIKKIQRLEIQWTALNVAIRTAVNILVALV